MKYILGFNQVNEGFLQKDKQKAIDTILSYLHKESKLDFYEYDLL